MSGRASSRHAAGGHAYPAGREPVRDRQILELGKREAVAVVSGEACPHHVAGTVA